MNRLNLSQPWTPAARRTEQIHTPEATRGQAFPLRAARAAAVALTAVGLLTQVACGSGAAAQNEPVTANAQDTASKNAPDATKTDPAAAGASSAAPSTQSTSAAPEPPLDAQAVQKACGDATHLLCGLKLARELNLSKTENGYTVKVTRVYADAAYLILQYEVAPPAGEKSDPRSINASLNVSMRPVDSIIPLEQAVGSEPPPPPPGQLPGLNAVMRGGPVGDPATSTQRYVAYEIGDMKSHPASLSFTVRVYVNKASTPRPSDQQPYPAAFSPPPKAAANPKPAPPPPREAPSSPPAPPGPPPLVAASFDITVPVQPSQVLDLKQSHKAGSATYTLERVVVTPIVTQLFVKKQRPATKALPTAFMPSEEVAVDLSAGDFKIDALTSSSIMGSTAKGEGWSTLHLMNPSLFGKEGEWTASMKEVTCGNTPCPRVQQPDPQRGNFILDLAKAKKLAGPFDFRFTPPKPTR